MCNVGNGSGIGRGFPALIEDGETQSKTGRAVTAATRADHRPAPPLNMPSVDAHLKSSVKFALKTKRYRQKANNNHFMLTYQQALIGHSR
jgi:hypothetical protein